LQALVVWHIVGRLQQECAGLQAEGDNRVLMQKVSKELLGTVDKAEVQKHAVYAKLPGAIRRKLLGTGSGNVLDENFQLHLLKTREKHLLNGLALKMHAAKQVSQLVSSVGPGPDINAVHGGMMPGRSLQTGTWQA
jgi:hypothetical protein